jgi:hypothetical protein
MVVPEACEHQYSHEIHMTDSVTLFTSPILEEATPEKKDPAGSVSPLVDKHATVDEKSTFVFIHPEGEDKPEEKEHEPSAEKNDSMKYSKTGLFTDPIGENE